MNARKLLLFSVTAVVALGGGVLAADAWSHRIVNYEQCMLDEMRGQVAQMKPMAHLECAKRSGKAVELSVSEMKPDWTVTGNGSVMITFGPFDRRVTRGFFQFSSKPCADTNILEYVVHREWPADEFGIVVGNLQVTEEEKKQGFNAPTCMRTALLYGVYERDPSLWTRLTGW